jgi:Bacterial archaeo-eukaryotic release factor family 11
MLHVDIPTLPEFKALAAARSDVCVSLYAPTSPVSNHEWSNRIAFKDLAQEALSQLQQAGADKRRMALLKEQFDHLAGRDQSSKDEDKTRKLQRKKSDDIDEFWRFQANGLAVLATPDRMLTYRLQYRPKQLAEVADRFHLTPLLRAMTSLHSIFVLALSSEAVRFVHAFLNLPPAEIKIPALPKNAEEATRRPSVHVRAQRGHLQNLEGEKVLLHKYVRKVHEALRGVLAGQATPLVLAGSEPLVSMFRSVNTYPNLVEEMVSGNPQLMSNAQLEDAVLPILDRLHARELKTVIALYDELKPRRATTDVSYVAHAATAGAVDQLLVDLDAVIPGLVSDIDGSVTYAASDDAETYSVVDEVAKRALCTGARVLGASQQELPNNAPLVAILRYQFG